jgi:hypothetical protein
MTDEEEKSTKHRYMALQMREFFEHQHYLGIRHDRPVDFNETLFDWDKSGHAKRFRTIYNERKHIIEEYCNSCNKCLDVMGCRLENGLVHKLLND